MKRSTCLFLLTSTLLLFGWSEINAAKLPEPPPLTDEMRNWRPGQPLPSFPDPKNMVKQLEQLDRLLNMPPSELTKLRKSIEFIESMSPENRQEMRDRVAMITRLTDGLETEIKNLNYLVKGNLREDFTQYWLSLDPESREKIRKQWETLSTEEKKVDIQNRIERFIEERNTFFE